MKQYIAKWLPVDGEIKDGDWCIYKNKFMHDPIICRAYTHPNHCGFLYDDGSFNRSIGEGITPLQGEVKIAKLFLYKPKIEVGAFAKWSTLFNYWNQITEVNIVEEYIKLEGDDERLYIDDCMFKDYEQIGEISPGAYGYVKDGHKFDETQVLLMTSGPDDNIFSTVGWNFFKQTTLPKRIAIKGPCGHFH